MEIDVILTQCCNKLIEAYSLSYCRVLVKKENITDIDKVSLFFSKRRINNLGALIGREIYLILGGGVRVVFDKENVNTNLQEEEFKELLIYIRRLSY